MTYRVELIHEAVLDIEEIFLWYQAVSSQLRDRFQDQLEIALSEILSRPMAFHSLSRKARCRKLKRFPYLIIYTVQTDLISVIAVIHESRDSNVWKRRFRRK